MPVDTQLTGAKLDARLCGGSLVHSAVAPAGAGFQVPLAQPIREEASVATSTAGLITEPS